MRGVVIKPEGDEQGRYFLNLVEKANGNRCERWVIKKMSPSQGWAKISRMQKKEGGNVDVPVKASGSPRLAKKNEINFSGGKRLKCSYICQMVSSQGSK